MPRRYASMEDRIIANSVLSQERMFDGTSCWEWTGQRKLNRASKWYGYISIRVHGVVKSLLVHRVVLKVFKGRYLSSRDVGKHLCNNTLCCNPAHLVGGTQSSNVRQCVREGRHYTPWRKAA